MKVIQNNNTIKANVIHGSNVMSISPSNKPTIIGDRYTDEYEIVPSCDEKIIINTKGKLMIDDLVIMPAPIPKRYGLVLYDGFGLTIT